MTELPQVGTRMTAAEFAQLPETTQRVELIDGEIIMSPAPKDQHQAIIGYVFAFLLGLGRGTARLSPSDVHLTDKIVLQPDVFWVHGPDSACQLGSDDYWHGPPDLVVEVLSPSTEVRDRGVKFKHYESSGVREYWLLDVDGQFVEVFRLKAGSFSQLGMYAVDKEFTSPLLGVTVVIKDFFRD